MNAVMDLREKIESKKEFITRHGFFGEHIDRYVFCAELIQEKYGAPFVLDVACGRGFGAWILAHTAGSRVRAGDINSEDVDFAKKNFAADNIEYSVLDAARISFAENTFDAAVSIETIEHLDEAQQKDFLAGLARCVKPEGLIIISTPDRLVWQSQAMHQHDHLRELTKKELELLLAGFFSLEGLYGVHPIRKQSLAKKAVRAFLIFLKRLDVIGLRYKLTSGVFRESLDAKTAPWESDTRPVLLGDGETASDLIAVCRNKSSLLAP